MAASPLLPLLCLLLLSFLLLPSPTSASLIVTSAGGNRDLEVKYWVADVGENIPDLPVRDVATRSLVVNAPVIDFENKNATVNGSIVLFFYWHGYKLAQELLDLHRQGAAAIILGTSYYEPGRTIWQVRQQKKETDISSVKIPILGISSSTSPETLLWEKLALNDGTVIRANITTDDLRNPFKDRADDPSSVAVQFFIAFPAFCAFSFGVFILVMIGRAEKPLCGAVGPTVVWMELVSNLSRIVWGAVNTFNMRSMFTEVVAQLWYTNHLAISIASNLLILLYWNDAVLRFGATSLSSFKLPVFIFVGFVIAVEIATSVIRGFELSNITLIATQVFYAIVTVATLAYIIYTAVVIYIKLRDTMKQPKKGTGYERVQKAAEKMTKVVIVLAVVALCRLIIVGIGLTPVVRTSLGDFVFWTIYAATLSAESAVKLLVIKVPRSKGAVSSVDSATTGKSSRNSRTSRNSMNLTATKDEDRATTTTHSRESNGAAM